MKSFFRTKGVRPNRTLQIVVTSCLYWQSCSSLRTNSRSARLWTPRPRARRLPPDNRGTQYDFNNWGRKSIDSTHSAVPLGVMDVENGVSIMTSLSEWMHPVHFSTAASTMDTISSSLSPAAITVTTTTSSTIASSFPDLLVSTATTLEKASIESSTLSALGHDLFTFLLCSVIVVPLSRLFNITPVLGFLIIGCLLGPYNLALFSNNEADVEIGDFGIVFLLFNEGLSLSPERIRDVKSFSNLGVLQLTLTICLFFFGTTVGGPIVLTLCENVGIPLDDTLLRPILTSPVQAFCIAAAGSLSSSAFVLPVLKSKQWEERPEGISALSILLLQDLAVAPLLVILPLVAGLGPQTLSELGILIAKATLGFGAVLALGSYVLRYAFEIVAAARSTETFVAATLLVAIGMGQVADVLGLSASTGAFAAGVLLAGNKYRAQIQADIKPFEGILLGVFFMTAGANLDPQLVIQEWPTLLTGVLAFVISKAVIIFLGGPGLGLRPGEAIRVALTLSSGGEFSFVLFALAQDLGVLPDGLTKLLTASVVLSMSLTPLLAEVGDKLGDYLDSQQAERRRTNSPLAYFDKVVSDQDAQLLFQEIDVDNSGSIDLEELRVALIQRGVEYSSIANIFTEFDANGDGVISQEEWKAGLNANVLGSMMDQNKLQPSNPVLNTNSLSNSTDWSPDGRNLQPAPNQPMLFAKDAAVICGFGEAGQSIYQMMATSTSTYTTSTSNTNTNTNTDYQQVVAFDLNPTRITPHQPVIFGDGASISLFKAAGISTPRAVIVTYASDARRIETVSRLREFLPQQTPIYALAGSVRIGQDLIRAGATEVVYELTEACLRVGTLLGVGENELEYENMRRMMVLDSTSAETNNFAGGMTGSGSMGGTMTLVPTYSDRFLQDLADKTLLSRKELDRLYEIFSSMDVNNNGRVRDLQDIEELWRSLMRNADGGDALLDADALKRQMEEAGRGTGKLSFPEFVRISKRLPE